MARELEGIEVTIQGLDISHWQGLLTSESIIKMKSRNVEFVYLKFSQGVGFKDKYAESNARLLQDNGILIGPYHFTTSDNGITQYEWFVKCMGNFKFDLPPAMDCEAYVQYGPNAISVRELQLYGDPQNLLDVYGISYPSREVIDVIGRRLKVWMAGFPKLSEFPQPVIYTNASSGNKIFDMSSVSWSKYLLWVAHWNADTPTLPYIWKGKGYLIWQDYVASGTPYGIDSQVDHNVWGTLVDFPSPVVVSSSSLSSSPSPSQIFTDEVEVTIKKNGSIYMGTLEEIK